MDRARLEQRRAELAGELDRARNATLRIEGAIALIDELLQPEPSNEEASCPATP